VVDDPENKMAEESTTVEMSFIRLRRRKLVR